MLLRVSRFAFLLLLVSACAFDTKVDFSNPSSDSGSASQTDAAAPADDAGRSLFDANFGPDAGSGTLTFRNGLDGYAGTIDTYINSGAGDLPLGDLTSIKWEDDSVERGLLRFEGILGEGSRRVPFGATIVQASLSVTIFDASNDPGRLVEVAVDWDENVTHNSFGPQGGVQDADLHDGNVATMPMAVGRQILDVTQSVQRWADQTRVNQGWMIVSGSDNDAQCHSSEHLLSQSDRPSLVIEYVWP